MLQRVYRTELKLNPPNSVDSYNQIILTSWSVKGAHNFWMNVQLVTESKVKYWTVAGADLDARSLLARLYYKEVTNYIQLLKHFYCSHGRQTTPKCWSVDCSCQSWFVNWHDNLGWPMVIVHLCNNDVWAKVDVELAVGAGDDLEDPKVIEGFDGSWSDLLNAEKGSGSIGCTNPCCEAYFEKGFIAQIH